MNDPLLIIDVSYMAHRAFHAVGDLAYGGTGTGVIFGLLRDVLILQDRFQTGRCVFAFDHPARKHRSAILPSYKSSRTKRHQDEPEEDKIRRQEMQRQLRQLYFQYLPKAGFKNVFAAAGFEADDIIAQVARSLPQGDEAIIVSSDEDLWQCCSVRPQVSCWNPQKAHLTTHSGFVEKWGFEPEQWPLVKAIAGCSTDDVPGVKGVGEATAAKFLLGTLSTTSKAHAAIHAHPWEDNLRLVRLPFEGTPNFELGVDEVTEEKWAALADQLGMKSIRATTPRTATRTKKGRRRNGPSFGL